MLVRLLPDQAARYWEDIKMAIEASLPPVAGSQADRMSNILKSIMTDVVIVWVSTEQVQDANIITGLVLTSFTIDNVTETKSLLLYCVYGYGNGTDITWQDGMRTLKKFAIAKGCQQIVAYTDVPVMIKHAVDLGGEARYTFVTFPLDGRRHENIQQTGI